MSSIDKRPPPAGGNSIQQRRYMLWHKYGITPEQFDKMLAEQGGCCAICGSKMDKPHIDHDHDTGVRRKLLCLTCNVGLGSFKDSVRLLASAIVYLQDHGKDFE